MLRYKVKMFRVNHDNSVYSIIAARLISLTPMSRVKIFELLDCNCFEKLLKR